MKKILISLVMAVIAAPTFAQMTIEQIEKLNQTNPKDAQKEAVKFFKKNKKDLNAVVNLAKVFLRAKDFDTAENLGQMALAVNSKSAAVHNLLGDVWYSRDDGGQAAAEYEQAVTAAPTDTTAYLKYANIYKDKFPEQARQMLERMGQNCPGVNVKRLTADMLYRGNHPADAAKAYAECNLNDLTETDLANYVFCLSLFAKDFQKSYDVCNYAQQKYPDNATFNRFKIYNLADLKRFEEADSLVTPFFANTNVEKNYLDYMYLGHILKAGKKYDDALNAFTKVLELNDKRTDVFASMAEIYSDLKEPLKALETYKQYYEKSANQTPAMCTAMGNYYYEYADAHKDNKDEMTQFAQKADDCYNKAIAKTPTFYMYYIYKGRNALLYDKQAAFDALMKAKEVGGDKIPQNVLNLVDKYIKQTGISVPEPAPAATE